MLPIALYWPEGIANVLQECSNLVESVTSAGQWQAAWTATTPAAPHATQCSVFTSTSQPQPANATTASSSTT